MDINKKFNELIERAKQGSKDDFLRFVTGIYGIDECVFENMWKVPVIASWNGDSLITTSLSTKTKDDLLSTLSYIIENIDKQDNIKKRARECAEIFNKNIWINKWKEVIKSFNIKSKSKNIDLIEFYINDVDNINEKTFQKIKSELLKNQLIYIKSKKEIKNDKISGGLIQLVPFEEEIVSEAKIIYVEKGLKIKTKSNIEII